MEFKIAVMGGDGIGPEVTDQGVRALEAVGAAFGHSFNLSYGDIGGISIDKHGIPFTDEVRAMSGDNDAVLFGAVGGPKWDDPNATVRPEQGLLDIRAHMGVFANIRPVKVYPWLADASPLKASVLEGVDMVVVRELTGGLYYAEPRGRRETPGGIIAEDTMRYTEGEIERVLRVGFELARGRRKRLTSVDKANVLECSRLWRTVATRLGEEYPDVELEHVLRGRLRHAAHLAAGAVRRDRGREHLRGHPDRRGIGAWGVNGDAALGQPGGRAGGGAAVGGDVRADPRDSAGHCGQGHRQPHRLHPEHGHDAALLAGADRGGRSGGAGR